EPLHGTGLPVAAVLAAAKQLLVRLRHDARVKVEVVDGTQVFV
ncbi:hypothetical protein NAG22_29030, partial [Pseudomonas aeruginosa]|nr:hypothetical protein [Pseudomonas aeruginosa]